MCIFVYICIISDEYVLILCVFPVLGTKSGPHQELVGQLGAVSLWNSGGQSMAGV